MKAKGINKAAKVVDYSSVVFREDTLGMSSQVVEQKKIPINANDPAMQDGQKEALDKTRNEVRRQLEMAPTS